MWALRFTGLFATVVLLMLYVDVGESGVAGGFFKNEAHPGKCYINADIILSEGEKKKDLEFCTKYYCNDGKTGYSIITECLQLHTPPNCKWTNPIDVNATFPLCCLKNFYCARRKDLLEAYEAVEWLKEEFQRQDQTA